MAWSRTKQPTAATNDVSGDRRIPRYSHQMQSSIVIIGHNYVWPVFWPVLAMLAVMELQYSRSALNATLTCACTCICTCTVYMYVVYMYMSTWRQQKFAKSLFVYLPMNTVQPLSRRKIAFHGNVTFLLLSPSRRYDCFLWHSSSKNTVRKA